jgi:polyisoprenoid-binding protein YceI
VAHARRAAIGCFAFNEGSAMKRMNSMLFATALGAISLLAVAETLQAPPAKAAAAEAPLPPPNMNPAAMPAGTYKLDARHAHVTGTVMRQGISDYQFRFNKLDASFTYDPQNAEASKVEVTVDPASFDSAVGPIDNNVRNDLLEPMKFPQIRFVSTAIRRGAGNKGTMTGNVSLMGVTRPLTFDVTFLGFNSARRFSAGFGATTLVKISDLGPVGVLFRDDHNLSDEVRLTIDAVFDKQ